MTEQPIQDQVSSPAPAAPAAPLPSPGIWLKQAREQAGMSVEQVAKDLYLDTQIIRAIELDQYARVGAPVYARGYLRRYAKLVGVAETGVLARYDTLQGTPRAVDPIPVAHGSIPAPRQWVPRWLGWVLLVLVVVTLVMVVIQSRPDLAGVFSTAFTDPPVIDQAPEAAPSPAVTLAPSPTPLARVDDGATANQPPAAGAITVQVNLSGDSWMEIYDASQKPVLYGMLLQGQRRQVSGMPPLKITLGSAQSVQLAVNGLKLAVPANKIQANVAHFDINAAGQIQ